MSDAHAETCPWCGQWTRLVAVAGHLQCDSCHRVVKDCCDGEMAEKEEPEG